MTDTKELKVKEKHEVAAPAEQMQPGRVFTPDVDIFEDEREITLLADMPGVAGEDIEIDLREGVLTVSGEVKPFESSDETDILIEFEIGKYFRQFTLSEAVDQSKIEAHAADGVLRLSLPKAEAAVPRKIKVSAS
jgi:HSP20 family molecular chaperone IbpA